LDIPIHLLAILSLLGSELGFLLVPATGTDLPVVWPPTGILVAALLLSDRARWKTCIAVAAAAAAVSCLAHGLPVRLAVVLSAVPALEGLLTAWVVRRERNEPFGLDRIAGTWRLALAGLAVPVAGSVVGTVILGSGEFGTPFTAARAWWLREALGILIIAPLAMGLVKEGRRLRDITPSRAVEAIVVFGGLTTVTALIFGEIIDPFLSVPTYVLPFILWAAFRFGPAGSATTVFLVMAVAMWNAARGQGPLAAGVPVLNLIARSQGAMVVATISFMMLASSIAERRRIADENTRLVGRLQQALAEVKTLQGFIPICAWCHKVRDDAGFWQQIEKYLDARTEATFSHSICPSCASDASDEIGVQLMPPPQ